MSGHDTGITEDTLAVVADLRARGSSWNATADAIGWAVAELRRTLRHASDVFERYYAAAEREVRRETEAEMLLVYRTQLRDEDATTRRKAADALAKHLAGERRDRTRVEVENIRAEIVRAKLNVKPASDEPEAELPIDATVLPPEEVHRPELEVVFARRAANEQAVVWLWGGQHKVGGTEPDPRTDVPLVLFGDDTVPGQRKVFWATRFPMPGNPFAGPFPAAPQEPVPDITPEQASQLESLPRPAPTAAPDGTRIG